jgi:hypothetical protein
MASELDSALECLDHYSSELTTVGADGWWAIVRQFLHEIQSSPLLHSVVKHVDWQDETNWYLHPRWAPPNPVLAAEQSYALLLAYFHEKGPTATVLGNLAIKSGTTVRANRWEMVDRPLLNQGYISPLVRYLKQSVESGPVLDLSIERWVRGLEWFGIPGVGDLEEHRQLDESSYQKNLHHYLYDRGFDFTDNLREVQTARGRVDLLLRSKEPVAVEIKLWKSPKSDSILQAWAVQARSYPRDLGIKRGCLVIINLCGETRLEFGDSLARTRTLEFPGIVVDLRVADVARLPACRDGLARTSRHLTGSVFAP